MVRAILRRIGMFKEAFTFVDERDWEFDPLFLGWQLNDEQLQSFIAL